MRHGSFKSMPGAVRPYERPNGEAPSARLDSAPGAEKITHDAVTPTEEWRTPGPSVGMVGANGFEEPQCRIDGVVLGSLPGIRKTVRQHDLINMLRIRTQNVSCNIEASSGKREPGKRDHGISAPIAEPVISGDDALLIAARNDVLICSGSQ